MCSHWLKDVNLGVGGKLNAYDISSTSDVLVWQNSAEGLFI